MKKLIIDLRGNPGGYLDQAYKLCDEILPQGKKVVYTIGRRPEFNEDYISSGGGKLTNTPIILLVDHGSASASEIVSGAVQDWDRGLIVGLTTFGKGLVQRQFDLPDKSAFRLTIAKYYTPSGRCIQRPYGKDIESYEREAFDRNETEGENIEHKNDNDSGKQVFKTAGGRKVYGGGGITPDYIVKGDTLAPYTRGLLGRNLFLDVVSTYMEKQSSDIKNKYGTDVKKFAADYSVDENLLKQLTDLADKKGLKMAEGDYKKDLPYIKIYLKAYVARNIWGTEGWRRCFHSMDTQFQKALTLFPEAQKIAGLK